MIHLSPEERSAVSTILKQVIPTYTVVVFGSRVTGAIKPFSDLDLAIQTREPLPLALLARLKEAFSESHLPFRVDVVDLASVTSEFRKVVEEQSEVITNSPV